VEGDTAKIKEWMETFERTGQAIFDAETMAEYRKGFLSKSISDEQTLKTIKNVFDEEYYLLDPHGAVAVAAADQLKAQLGGHPMICLATAHPAKFPETLERLLGADQMPRAAMHPSIEEAKVKCQKNYTCHYSHLHTALKETMNTHWDLHHPA
jgi:threonine synthase